MGARKLQVVGVRREAIELRDDMIRRTADRSRSAVESRVRLLGRSYGLFVGFQ